MKKKNSKWILLSLTAMLCLTACGQQKTGQETESTNSVTEAVTASADAKADTETAEKDGAAKETGEVGTTQAEENLLSEYQAKNADVHAYLEIPGTNISYPVLQSLEDEYFYLSHNMDKQEDTNGCIYTEYYNKQDFSDPNTVIYGRNTDAMFGRLHQYQDRDFFDKNRELVITTEDQILTYQIFAAYTYDDRHLIATYDFHDEAIFAQYLEDVFSIRAMDAYLDDSIEVTAQDKIVTLSTGVTGQDDKRYLVQAVLVKTE